MFVVVAFQMWEQGGALWMPTFKEAAEKRRTMWHKHQITYSKWNRQKNGHWKEKRNNFHLPNDWNDLEEPNLSK